MATLRGDYLDWDLHHGLPVDHLQPVDIDGTRASTTHREELCKVDAVVLTGTRIRQNVLVGTPAIRLKNHNHDVTIIAFYMPVRTTLAAEQKKHREGVDTLRKWIESVLLQVHSMARRSLVLLDRRPRRPQRQGQAPRGTSKQVVQLSEFEAELCRVWCDSPFDILAALFEPEGSQFQAGWQVHSG